MKRHTNLALSLVACALFGSCTAQPPPPTLQQCIQLGFAPKPTPKPNTPAPTRQPSPSNTSPAPASPPTQHTAASPPKPSKTQPAPQPKTQHTSQTTPTKFLIIGDSQVQHSFGFALDYLLRNAIEGSEIHTYAVCASHPISWVAGSKHNCGYMIRDASFQALPDARGPGFNGVTLGRNRTPKLLDLLHQHKPDVVLIALGENGKKSSTKHVRRSVHALARTVDCYKHGVRDEADCAHYIKHGTFPDTDDTTTTPVSSKGHSKGQSLQCLWVMPPYTRYDKEPAWLQSYYNLFQHEIGSSCTVIDSRPLTCTEGLQDPSKVCNRDTKHGIHFGRPRARLWSVAIFDRMTSLLRLDNALPEKRDTIAKGWGLRAQPAPK